jgi:hypothetical protein
MRFSQLGVVVLLCVVTAWAGSGGIETHSFATLGTEQKEGLRFRLENLFNEVDLIIKNQDVDRSDVRRQNKEMEALRVFERIPFQDDLSGLKKQLEMSAHDKGLKLLGISVISRYGQSATLPKVVFSDDRRFRLTADQVAERINFTVKVEGKKEALLRWMQSWRDGQLRLVEADGTPVTELAIRQNWMIRAHAFRFRKIRFPRLQVRDPFSVLPKWARKDPALFSKKEPLLWSFVNRTRRLTPRAQPFYEIRREFLLNQARLDFFFSKTLPPT